MSQHTSDESDIAYIDIGNINKPIDLLHKWITEFKSATNSDLIHFSLATCNGKGNVSNRSLVLRQVIGDNLVLMTDNNSKKIAHIGENCNVAACFLFNYDTDENKKVTQQVNVEGIAEQLPEQVCRDIYEKEPLYCKIRAHICDQGTQVEWQEMKDKHDKILKDVRDNQRQLEKPKHVVAYQIVPNYYDFYHTFNGEIADRVLFKKDCGNQWISHHIAA